MSLVSLAVFAGVLVPVLVALAVWVGLTAFRLLREEPADPVFTSEPMLREALRREGMGMRVGAREIRADLRHRERHGRTPAYRFEKSHRSGLPPAWMLDATRRCN
jgi:hypothetical protein